MVTQNKIISDIQTNRERTATESQPLLSTRWRSRRRVRTHATSTRNLGEELMPEVADCPLGLVVAGGQGVECESNPRSIEKHFTQRIKIWTNKKHMKAGI
jgi:hypothetical protein